MDEFEAEAANLYSSKQPSDELRMPQCVNLHELGRCRSKHIAEKSPKASTRPKLLLVLVQSKCLVHLP